MFHVVLCLFIVLMLKLFSCVLSSLIHNCCRRCLYILLHQVTLKINYWSDVLLSNRIFITWEDDRLYPVCRQEFNIARAHAVRSLLNCLWSMWLWRFPFSNTSEPRKVLILFCLLFCLLTNINSLFSISCCNMQNKRIQVELFTWFSVFFL